MEIGGSELNAIRTLESLDRSRFDLTVYHLGRQGPLLERYKRLGVTLIHISVRSFKHPSAFRAGVRLFRSLKQQRIQVLHAHDIYSNIFAVPWARLAGTPVVIASRRWQYAVPSRSHVAANRIVSRMATCVLANSEAVRTTLRVEDRVPESRIAVIPNFVGPEAFAGYPEDARLALFGQLGIPPGVPVVGSVARLSTTKDHATLLRAAAPVCAESPMHLLLIGSGPTLEPLRAQAATLGIADRVHFAGTLPNIPNPHGLLDVSVLASLTEGFPNSVVEAMAAGRPVIATAVGGTSEALQEGRTGYLFTPGDATALARSLRALLASPEQRRSFGEAGKALAETRYHRDRVIPHLSDWYYAVLSAS